jgi:hypothetical protein
MPLIHSTKPASPQSTCSVYDATDTNHNLVFGIMGIMIGFAALILAFLQLNKLERVHRIYELA